jgi:hypothetical protein
MSQDIHVRSSSVRIALSILASLLVSLLRINRDEDGLLITLVLEIMLEVVLPRRFFVHIS